MTDLRRTLKSVLRFACCSGFGTLAHYAVLVFCVEAVGFDAIWATSAGFVVGGATNYMLTRHFVFQTRKSHQSTAFQFLLMALIGMALNALVFAWLQRLGLFYLWAQITATCCVFLWSYSASRWVVFR